MATAGSFVMVVLLITICMVARTTTGRIAHLLVVPADLAYKLEERIFDILATFGRCLNELASELTGQ